MKKFRKKTDNDTDPFPTGEPALDFFQLITMISLKDKNGKISWGKVFSAIILFFLVLPFILASLNR